MRGLGRALAAALLAALRGAIALALFYGRSPALRVDFDVTPPRGIIDGVYASERDPTRAGRSRGPARPLTIDLAESTGRSTGPSTCACAAPVPAAPPTRISSFFVDGVLVLTHATTVDYEDVQRHDPGAAGAAAAWRSSMRASSTFVPGPSDPRALGVMLDSLSLAPDGIVLPPRPALTGVALASAALGAAVALLGVTPGTAVGAAVLLSAALAALVAARLRALHRLCRCRRADDPLDRCA